MKPVLLILFVLISFSSTGYYQNDTVHDGTANWKHKISLGTPLSPFAPLFSERYSYNRLGRWHPMIGYELRYSQNSSVRVSFAFQYSQDSSAVPGVLKNDLQQLRRTWISLEYKRRIIGSERLNLYGFTGLGWYRLTSDTTFTANVFKRGMSWGTGLYGLFGLGINYHFTPHFGIAMESDVVGIFERSGVKYYSGYPDPNSIKIKRNDYHYIGMGIFRLFGFSLSYRF